MHCHPQTAQALVGAVALFSFGLVGSLHCLGMCGPLSSLLGQGPEQAHALRAYHAARLTSYAALGALLSLLGSPLRAALPWPWAPLLWIIPLLFFALRPTQAPAWMNDWHRRAALQALRLSPKGRGLALGLLTPLLPCGLLYTAASAALSAPSAWSAAGWMAAFAAGTAPGLLLGQASMLSLAKWKQGAWAPWIQRSGALLTALLIFYFSKPG